MTALLYLLAALAVLWLATFAEDGEQAGAFTAGFALLLNWGWSKLLPASVDFLDYDALAQAGMAVIMAASWRRQPRIWKIGMLFAVMDCAALDLYRECSLWTGTRHNFILLLNALFAVELSCAAWPGGRGIASLARSGWILGGRRARRVLSPARRQRAKAFTR